MSHTAEPDVAARPGGQRRIPTCSTANTRRTLRAAVRALLEDRCTWPVVHGQERDRALRHRPVTAADLGCAGLLVPDEHGGAGASYREAAVVAEELGRAVAPVPYLAVPSWRPRRCWRRPSANLLAVLGDGAASRRRSPFVRVSAGRQASGDRPAWRAGSGRDVEGYRLTGSVSCVADALHPDAPAWYRPNSVPFGLYEVSGVSRTR